MTNKVSLIINEFDNLLNGPESDLVQLTESELKSRYIANTDQAEQFRVKRLLKLSNSEEKTLLDSLYEQVPGYLKDKWRVSLENFEDVPKNKRNIKVLAFLNFGIVAVQGDGYLPYNSETELKHHLTVIYSEILENKIRMLTLENKEINRIIFRKNAA